MKMSKVVDIDLPKKPYVHKKKGTQAMVALGWYDSLQHATTSHFPNCATINVMTEGYAANVPLFRDNMGSWKYNSFDDLGGESGSCGAWWTWLVRSTTIRRTW